MPADKSTNPLLSLSGLPRFSEIRPEHVVPAIDYLLAEARHRVDALLEQAGSYDWDNLVQPLEALSHRLARAWSAVEHLHAVADSEPLREAYNACLPKLTAYYAELGHNERLYRAYRAISEAPAAARLDTVQHKVIEDALRDFHLAGVDLSADKKARFKAISEELAALGSRFQQHLLDATHAWTKPIADPSQLQGLPESARALAWQTAARDSQEGWLFTLEEPSYMPVMRYADNRQLRREMYEAYVTRASDQGPNAGRWDNGPLMEAILRLRHEMAKLLGFGNYAEDSLARKMARSTDEVMAFLHELARHSRPMAGQELAQVARFAHEQDGLERLEAWDVTYYSERLRQHRYDFSQEDLRPFFAVPQVLDGLKS